MGVKWLFLASGRGSNFQAVAQAVQAGTLPQTTLIGLVSNRADAPALDIARGLAIPTSVVESRSFRTPDGKWDRAAYEAALESCIAGYAPDWIALGGYMLLLGEKIVRRWSNRIVNIHPSLLPAFPGLNAQRQALEAGVAWTGCTVHLVNEALDAGAIVEQARLEILEGETEASLTERLLPLEHATYVRAVERLSRSSNKAKSPKG